MITINRRTIAAFNIALATAMLAPATFAAPSAAAPGAPTLDIGDTAPVLQPAKWVKGAPIPTFEKGHVYVVEFWATWCGPCKANIPHLTALAKQLKGKAEIIGVDVWESPDASINSMPKVRKFVKSQGDHMNYHVAADGNDNKVADLWMKAAGEGGLPTAFIIGKDGHVAWIGNASTDLGLGKVVQQVIDDKFDIAAARAARQKQVGPTQAIEMALNAKDYPRALTLTDAAIASNPNNERRYSMYRYVALAHVDLPKFKTIVRDTLTQENGEIGVYQMFCSIPASQMDLSPEAYKFGRSLVDEALLKKDREYLFYAMGAAMDSQLGNKDAAVTSQEAAVKAAESDTHCPPEFLQFLRNSLDKLKAKAAA